MQHRAPRRDAYNLTWRMRVAGIDAGTLRRAWHLVTERHEALRTSFSRRDDTVVQEVRPAVESELAEVCWDTVPPLPAGGRTRGAGPADAGALLDSLAGQWHARPFELDAAPLARAALVRAADRQELWVTAHHTVLDGWALHLVVEDLERAYLAVRDRGPDVAADEVFDGPPVTHRAFAERARGPLRSAERAFWPLRLAGTRAAALAPDPAGGADAGGPGSGEVLRHRQPPAVTTAVAACARRAGCTAFAVQLAALRAVLALGGARGRTALGVMVANRSTPEDLRRVGYCGNVLLSADEVSPAESFDAVVARARDGLWESLPYQHIGFADAVADLSPGDRTALGSGPEIVITHHGSIGSGLSLGGRPARLLPSPSTSARCQVLISLFEDDAGTVVEVEYDTRRLSRSTVRALLDDLDRVLAASAEAGGTLDRLSVTSRAAARDTAPAAEARSTGAGAAADDGMLGVWREILGVEVGAEDDFFQLGGRSLQVLSLIATVEDRTGSRIDVADWLDRPTPARLARLVAEQAPGHAPGGEAPPTAPVAADPEAVPPDAEPGGGPRWLSTGSPGGPHLHLVHGAGVGRLPYRSLVAALPPHWRVSVSEDDGSCGADLAAMADRYARTLQAGTGLPDVLGGWSMGGLLAHAVAVRLRQAGHRPPPLLLLDAPPPDHGHDYAVTDFGSFAEAVLRGAGAHALCPDVLRTATPERAGTEMLTALLRAAGHDARPDSLAARWELHRRHHAAMAGYRDAEPVDSPALAVAADLPDVLVRRWDTWCTGGLSAERLDTDHYGMLRDPHARRLAALAAGLLPAVAGAAGSAGRSG